MADEQSNIKVPNGFVLVSDFRSDKITDDILKIKKEDGDHDTKVAAIQTSRYTTEGKLLKTIFMLGPSKAVLSNGTVVVSSTNILNDDEQAQQDKEEQEKSKDDESSKEQSTNDESSKEQSSDTANDSSAKESYHYSISEAYLRMFEAEAQQDADNTPSDSAKSDSETTDKDNNQNDTEGTAQKNNSEPGEDKNFIPGSHIYVKVELPNEGCTVWHLVVDERVEDKLQNIKNILKAKKFKAAYEFANKAMVDQNNEDGTPKGKSDGLIVLSMRSYLNTKAPSEMPFLGKCRYAIDSGSKNDDSNMQTVSVAIAPINAKTRKPEQSNVFLKSYNIIGDFTGGKLAEILMSLSGKARDDADGKRVDWIDTDTEYKPDDDKAAERISKYLNARFRTPGDDSMYKNFLEIRKFIEDSIKNSTLEINKDENETVDNYRQSTEIKGKESAGRMIRF